MDRHAVPMSDDASGADSAGRASCERSAGIRQRPKTNYRNRDNSLATQIKDILAIESLPDPQQKLGNIAPETRRIIKPEKRAEK